MDMHSSFYSYIFHFIRQPINKQKKKVGNKLMRCDTLWQLNSGYNLYRIVFAVDNLNSLSIQWNGRYGLNANSTFEWTIDMLVTLCYVKRYELWRNSFGVFSIREYRNGLILRPLHKFQLDCLFFFSNDKYTFSISWNQIVWYL